MAAADIDVVLDVHDRPRPGTWAILSLQHLFAMFGATILVPFLTGLNPAVALVTSGLGTLLYILCTGARIPAYLGSSFAFITPIISAASIAGTGGALVGALVAGLIYVVVAFFIWKAGIGWLMRLLPPIVVGPVIMVIGLSLASVAVDMAMNIPGQGTYSAPHFATAMATLLIAILCGMFLKGVFALVPILFGIVGGYVVGLALGIVDVSHVAEAAWFAVPAFALPSFDLPWPQLLACILVVAPVAVVTLAEHTGDQMVLSKVTGRNFLEKPGLHRSILGDGAATILAALLGGPPNTTYGENIGVIAITRVMSVYVIGGAACLAVVFGFVGKIAALIQTIPTAVMGGVSILLFGIIASSGMRMLIDRHVDLGRKRNLIISSVILVIGIGGALVQMPFSVDVEGETVEISVKIAGMALATLVGLVLNLLLPGREAAEHGGSIFQRTEA
ncbi:uracil-xanthine permease family protein [Caenispirillum bisanense]|uniref:Uracil permease n=1 Tax=Caenispirillum bisanense TaxID=414052 RepID=A0A286GST1_9PROT|nr:solute carrier family 23 protein [Caenispirillum bisanense]SOD98129.1 uracil permease [Caenispirillum bisanense]